MHYFAIELPYFEYNLWKPLLILAWWKLKVGQFQKTIFMITFFGHSNVFSPNNINVILLCYFIIFTTLMWIQQHRYKGVRFGTNCLVSSQGWENKFHIIKRKVVFHIIVLSLTNYFFWVWACVFYSRSWKQIKKTLGINIYFIHSCMSCGHDYLKGIQERAK